MLRSKAKAPAKRKSVTDRIRAIVLGPDRYAIVLCLILAALVITGATGESILARIVVTALLGVNVVYTMVVSRTPGRWVAVASLIVGAALLLAVVAQALSSPRLATLPKRVWAPSSSSRRRR